MNKTNIKCPRCHSAELYKFGLDKRANQKISMQEVQVSICSILRQCKKESLYPRCPICIRASYLNH